MSALVPFDYAALDAAVAEAARDCAARIQGLFRNQQTAVIDAGKELLGIKDKLGHGHFGRWLLAEFGFSERTAENYMQAARMFGDKSEMVSGLQVATIYKLAAKSTPEAVKQDVVERIGAGEPMSDAEIRRCIDAAREAERRAEEEQRRAAKEASLTPETKARREAKLQRERKEWQAQVERERANAAAAVALLVECLGDRLGEFKRLYASARDFSDALANAQRQVVVRHQAVIEQPEVVVRHQAIIEQPEVVVRHQAVIEQPEVVVQQPEADQAMAAFNASGDIAATGRWALRYGPYCNEPAPPGASDEFVTLFVDVFGEGERNAFRARLNKIPTAKAA